MISPDNLNIESIEIYELMTARIRRWVALNSYYMLNYPKLLYLVLNYVTVAILRYIQCKCYYPKLYYGKCNVN